MSLTDTLKDGLIQGARRKGLIAPFRPVFFESAFPADVPVEPELKINGFDNNSGRKSLLPAFRLALHNGSRKNPLVYLPGMTGMGPRAQINFICEIYKDGASRPGFWEQGKFLRLSCLLDENGRPGLHKMAVKTRSTHAPVRAGFAYRQETEREIGDLMPDEGVRWFFKEYAKETGDRSHEDCGLEHLRPIGAYMGCRTGVYAIRTLPSLNAMLPFEFCEDLTLSKSWDMAGHLPSMYSTEQAIYEQVEAEILALMGVKGGRIPREPERADIALQAMSSASKRLREALFTGDRVERSEGFGSKSENCVDQALHHDDSFLHELPADFPYQQGWGEDALMRILIARQRPLAEMLEDPGLHAGWQREAGIMLGIRQRYNDDLAARSADFAYGLNLAA